MYNLHAIINLKNLLISLLNIGGLFTSIFNLVLGFGATASSFSIPSLATNNACNTTLPTVLSIVKFDLKSYVDSYCSVVVNQWIRVLIVVV